MAYSSKISENKNGEQFKKALHLGYEILDRKDPGLWTWKGRRVDKREDNLSRKVIPIQPFASTARTIWRIDVVLVRALTPTSQIIPIKFKLKFIVHKLLGMHISTCLNQFIMVIKFRSSSMLPNEKSKVLSQNWCWCFAEPHIFRSHNVNVHSSNCSHSFNHTRNRNYNHHSGERGLRGSAMVVIKSIKPYVS